VPAWATGQRAASAADEQWDLPDLVTPRTFSLAQLQLHSVQVSLRDAHNVGESELVGVASVPLSAGVLSSSDAEPVFFVVPLLAQTRYVGFLTGFFRVEAC
jgi:hypothetical protein